MLNAMNWIKREYVRNKKMSHQIKKQREFGGVLLVFAVLILVVSFYKLGFVFNFKQSILMVLIFLLLGITILLPKMLMPLLLVWFIIGTVLGEITSFVVMGILYFCLISPISLILKLKRKKEKPGWKERKGTINYQKLS